MKPHRFNLLRFANTAVILAGLCLIAYLSWQLAGRVRDLQGAPIDNVQWNLSQLEVDYLKLRNAGETVLHDGSGALPEFRKRYDIFYSRVFVINGSAATEQVHASPRLHHLHENLKGFLAETVNLIDGPNAELIAAMPTFLGSLAPVAAASRGLSMGGVEISSKIADAKRVEVSRLLFLITLAAPMTFMALFLALAWQHSQKKELNRRSQKIVSANRRYNSTLRASLDAIVVVNETGHITDFNGSAEQIFGYTRDQVIGKSLAKTLIPQHLREAHSARLSTFASDREAGALNADRLEMEALHNDGHIFPIDISIAQTEGENGLNFVSYIRDITKQHENQAELHKARDDALEASREKSKFFALMSHEMRTPLNGIMSSLDLLKDGTLDEAQHRYVNIAETSSRILLSHVNNVLTIERLDAGNREILPELFNISEVVATLIDTLGPLANERNNLLIAEHQGPEPLVAGDLRSLQQILINLMSNAIKFTSSGRVTIETETLPTMDDRVVLRCAVRDTGIGISLENQERILEDFVTIESPYERTATGTGLGLGIVRRLVDGMGGTLSFESSPAIGSTFRFEATFLPAAAPETIPTVKAKSKKHNAKAALHVLLVEDNAINRELLEAMVRREGHEVSIATNGFEGVHKAHEQHFDLILMDISMPNMNGIVATQTIRASKSLSAHTPIYAVTAHAMPTEVLEFSEAGMDGCLIKPIQVAKLRDVLAAVLKSEKVQDLRAPPRQEEISLQSNLLDHAQIAELVSVLGKAKARRMFDSFCTNSMQGLAELRTSAADGDIDRLAVLAHRLSGSCSTFGAVRMKDLLHKIEAACKQGDLERAVDLPAQLDQIWQDTYTSFTKARLIG